MTLTALVIRTNQDTGVYTLVEFYSESTRVSTFELDTIIQNLDDYKRDGILALNINGDEFKVLYDSIKSQCSKIYDDIIEQWGKDINKPVVPSPIKKVDNKMSDQMNTEIKPNLPKVRDDLKDFEKDAMPSVTVLVRIVKQDDSSCARARYYHGLEEWQIDGWTGFFGNCKIVEWWYFPEAGTGTNPNL